MTGNRRAMAGTSRPIGSDLKRVDAYILGPADYADLGFASADDPTFKDMLAKGTSNSVLIDLTTGQHRRVTNMHAGQYALYPHFRSDGWIYFLVRDKVSNKEYAVASDAAL